MSLFIYIIFWADERKDIPLFQSMFFSVFLWGKVASAVVFALTMRNATAQSIFFCSISILSLLATVGFTCIFLILMRYLVIPTPPHKKMPLERPPEKINGSTIESAENINKDSLIEKTENPQEIQNSSPKPDLRFCEVNVYNKNE